MPVKNNPPVEEVDEIPLEPGFYVGDNGPYATAEDAQAFIDGHLNGKGKVTEVSVEE